MVASPADMVGRLISCCGSIPDNFCQVSGTGSSRVITGPRTVTLNSAAPGAAAGNGAAPLDMGQREIRSNLALPRDCATCTAASRRPRCDREGDENGGAIETRTGTRQAEPGDGFTCDGVGRDGAAVAGALRRAPARSASPCPAARPLCHRPSGAACAAATGRGGPSAGRSGRGRRGLAVCAGPRPAAAGAGCRRSGVCGSGQVRANRSDQARREALRVGSRGRWPHYSGGLGAAGSVASTARLVPRRPGRSARLGTANRPASAAAGVGVNRTSARRGFLRSHRLNHRRRRRWWPNCGASGSMSRQIGGKPTPSAFVVTSERDETCRRPQSLETGCRSSPKLRRPARQRGQAERAPERSRPLPNAALYRHRRCKRPGDGGRAQPIPAPFGDDPHLLGPRRRARLARNPDQHRGRARRGRARGGRAPCRDLRTAGPLDSFRRESRRRDRSSCVGGGCGGIGRRAALDPERPHQGSDRSVLAWARWRRAYQKEHPHQEHDVESANHRLGAAADRRGQGPWR